MGFAAALAIFEIVRNWGAWGLHPSSWLIDYAASAFLIAGALGALSDHRRTGLLAASWGGATTLVTGSLMGNTEHLLEGGENFGPIPQGAYVAIVAVAWVFVVVMTVLCVRLNDAARASSSE